MDAAAEVHEPVDHLPQLTSLRHELPGNDGGQGEQGPSDNPGEVTNASLADAIATTARNPLSIAPLTQTISDPPTQGQVHNIQNAHHELLAIIFRPPT